MISKRTSPLVLLFFFYTAISITRIHAQAHPEMLDVSINKGWHQTFDFYFDYYRGNVNQMNISTNITSSFHAGKHESMLEGTYWLGFYESEKVLHQVNFTGRHVRSFGKDMDASPWSMDFWGQYQSDMLIALDDRLAIGAGIRHEFFRKGGPDDPYDMYLGSGFFYEAEDFREEVQRDRRRIRWGNYVTQTWEPNDDWLINIGTYLNIDVADFSGFRQLVLVDLQYALGENIYLTSKSWSRFDSAPGADVKKFDLFSIFGISYTF